MSIRTKHRKLSNGAVHVMSIPGGKYAVSHWTWTTNRMVVTKHDTLSEANKHAADIVARDKRLVAAKKASKRK